MKPDRRLLTVAAFLWFIRTGRDVMSRITNKSEAERKFLIVYTVLALLFLAAGVSAAAAFPVFLGTVPEIVFCWVLYGCQKGDSTSRAVIMTVSALVTMSFFGVMVLTMDVLIPLFAVLLAMIGMFNSGRLLWLWAADAVLMFLYHLSVRKSYDFEVADTWLRIFFQLSCLALMLYLERVMIRKNIERKKQMSGMIELLQESERRKDEFMSSVSREFKAPLDAICSMGEMILNSDVQGDVREAAETLLASGRNLREFVGDMSDYLEIEGGRLALKEEIYSFASLLQDIVDIADEQNAEKKLEIIVDCDANVPRAMVGDSEKLRKVILCLMSNAIKFTPNGFVSLNISARRESYGVNLCISVRDTGIGMSKETVARIFTDFGRADAEADSRFRGAGLGLALTRRLVEMMKGLINVTSEQGAGSEFRVVIPQKVVDSRPIVEVPDRENIKVISYIDIEKYSMPELRSAYVKWIEDVEKGMGISIDLCTGLTECKRRMDRASYTHMIIAIDEYRQEPWYFEAVNKKMPVVIVMDRNDRTEPGENFVIIYKPVTVFSALDALAGRSQRKGSRGEEDSLQAPEGGGSESGRNAKREADSEREGGGNAKKEADGERGSGENADSAHEDRTVNTEEKRPSRIDRAIGENYCGGRESYLEILKIFLEYGAEKRRELQKLYDKKDWPGYAIEIHALKSTALGIGAVALSEMAKTLELAAKQENESILTQNHESAMKEYRHVLTEIAEGLEEN